MYSVFVTIPLSSETGSFSLEEKGDSVLNIGPARVR